MNKIILAGGTGLIGKYLQNAFREKNYTYTVLTRNAKLSKQEGFAYWNPEKGELQENALEGAEFIINLSGANVGKGRWTRKRRQVIRDSRILSTQLLFDAVKRMDKKPKAYISASAIGYYGLNNTSIIHTESEEPANDFLGQVCKEWEAAAMQFKNIGVRTVILRTGLVLAREAQSWKMMKFPIRFGLGANIGNGQQILPWIHIEDMVNLYLFAMFTKSLKGSFNAVSPDFITLDDFNRGLAKHLKRPFFLPGIPPFLVRLIMGKKAVILLNGNRISSEKVSSEGFHFNYTYIQKAFEDLT